jgi:hypothetical protein
MNNNKDGAVVGRSTLTFATLLAGLVVASSASAQRSESLIVDVGECVKLESPGERLDCYERQVKRAQAAPAASAAAAPQPAPAAPSAAAPSAAAPSAQPQRNVRVEDARVANGTPSREPALSGTISALREIVPNRWLITLDNGQMWRQTYAEPFRLRIGQRVELTQGRGRSSYELTAVGMSGDIQVESVR